MKWSESPSAISDSLWPHGLYSPWNSPGQNTGVGSLSLLPLLQGIFPTQGSNPGLPHCRQILYQLSHRGSPRILEWVAYPFSRGSSRSRNWTQGSCIAGGFFTNWAIREATVFKQSAKIRGLDRGQVCQGQERNMAGVKPYSAPLYHEFSPLLMLWISHQVSNALFPAGYLKEQVMEWGTS